MTFPPCAWPSSNACETARVTKDRGLDPFAGAASSMVLAGIPAVVAMQFPITDGAAITFARRFYTLLARFPIDQQISGAATAFFWPSCCPWDLGDSGSVGISGQRHDQYGWDESQWYDDESASPPGANNVAGATSEGSEYNWFGGGEKGPGLRGWPLPHSCKGSGLADIPTN